MYPYIIQCPPLCVNPCNPNMVCEDPSQTRVHEVMCRPVRAFPCRIICYSPPPLTQHPQHAAEPLFQRIDAHTFGSYESASTTLEAQHSKDQKQHAWNANSLPSTMNTASTISDMIAPPGHLSTGLLGFPFGTVANFDTSRSSGSAKVHRYSICLSSYSSRVTDIINIRYAIRRY